MSNTKFIISIKNPHKCEPDAFYYCVANLNHDGDSVWDPDPEKARVFHSMDSVVAGVEQLTGDGVQDLRVWQRIITHEQIDTARFTEIVTKNKVRKIIDMLDDSDVEFLVKHANLDLTIVT